MTYRRRAAVLLLTAGLLAAAGPTGHASAQTGPHPVTVSVNTRAGLGTVPATGLGVNHAVWDSQLGTPQVADLLKNAGVGMMRYPGGSYSDIYHWKDNTAPGGYVAPDTDFDTFMGGVQRAGAQPIITANYGTGTPQEAADWVRYANVTKGYGAKYWEIGNELYGNGHYGADWEADNHADKSPTAYANGVVAYSQAMKAVDPTVKIGAVLTTPGSWPDGVVGSGDTATWNQTVLSIAGPSIDFVVLHWYPGGSTAPDALSKPTRLTDAVYLVRQQMAKFATVKGIALTEFDSGFGNNTQPGAMFAADTYASLLENGVFTVDWWNIHNGGTAASTVAGQPDYADMGLLSSATCLPDGTCEPPMNTPFAPYYAIQILHDVLHPGDQLVRASTDVPAVKAHATRRPNGDVDVLLVNEDPDNAYTVNLTGATYQYTNGATAVTTPTDGTTLPPYSLTGFVLHGAATTVNAPGQPVAAAVTDTGATITWPAAAPGSRPIAKYEVDNQAGGELGETTGTSLSVGNLTPGTRYTVNVLTRDSSGAVSWASPPLTFTTGSPALSTCAVRFADVNDWGSGFVASVDVTSTSALAGWTLTFSWPTAWQQLNGGWNATWTQTGSEVKVTQGAALAPGVSTNIGFVGAYQGPNVLPGTFRLNGTVCTVQ